MSDRFSFLLNKQIQHNKKTIVEGSGPRKEQANDEESRGGCPSPPPGSLPDLPDGVAWKQNPTTKRWTLIRIDQQHENDLYKLKPAVAWNPNTGREQLIVKPVLKKKKRREGDDDDASTVATTSMSMIGLDDDDDIDDDNRKEDDNNNNNIGSGATTTNEDDPPEKEPPVVGRDYVVHTLVPSDTFGGLLLRYRVTAVALRRINRFSGTNLSLAPPRLVVPLAGSLSNIKIQDVTSEEYKLQVLLVDFPHLHVSERKSYLEMNDWNLEAAKQQIEDDHDWETKQRRKEQKLVSKLKALAF